MKKQYKWLAKNGRIFLLKRSLNLFGEGWESVGTFDDKDGNAARVKNITKQLNECAKHTESLNQND